MRSRLEGAARRTLPERVLRALRGVRRHWQSGLTSNYRTLGSLDVFYPNSANFWAFPEVTLSGANTLPERLLELMDRLEISPRKGLPARGAEAIFGAEPGPGATELERLFDHYGSDKGSTNGYQAVYAAILSELAARPGLQVLEIGLGTADPGALSSMGRGGRPGASLRAFRDFLPEATIHGADIDERILFHEERIRTARVDQLDPSSFVEMTEALGCEQFDLIIDDGLHSVEANLNTLLFALRALRPEGWVVIEDIPERTTVVWRLIGHLLEMHGRDARLIRCRLSNVFVVQL